MHDGRWIEAVAGLRGAIRERWRVGLLASTQGGWTWAGSFVLLGDVVSRAVFVCAEESPSIDGAALRTRLRAIGGADGERRDSHGATSM